MMENQKYGNSDLFTNVAPPSPLAAALKQDQFLNGEF